MQGYIPVLRYCKKDLSNVIYDQTFRKPLQWMFSTGSCTSSLVMSSCHVLILYLSLCLFISTPAVATALQSNHCRRKLMQALPLLIVKQIK